MRKRGALTAVLLLALGGGSLFWGIDRSIAQSQPADQTAVQEAQKTARQRRQEANARLQAAKAGLAPDQTTGTAAAASQAAVAAPKAASLAFQTAAAPQASQTAGTAPRIAAAAPPLTLPSGMNPLVDLNLPNYANSPNIRKFVDTLPGLGAALVPGASYIPVAVADPNAFAGSDYYEIGLVCYSQKMNVDLPPTDLRGYVQLETPANLAVSKHIALTYPGGAPILNNGAQIYAVDNPSYLGPVILATKSRPVRVKFTNYLPAGMAGNLPLPVDTGVMGAGMGPIGTNMYTQNRGTLHLHGGRTPWISDGTPHQWTVPVGDTSVYQKGASATNVPDMPDPGQGSLTFYWTNEQSARLMFYHDHAYGITRLNVYAGEAAGYLIHDQVEEDLISGTNVSGGNPAAAKIIPDPLGGLYHYGIPLVIQDKTFVNDATTPPGAGFAATGAVPTPPTQTVDPLWYTYVSGTHGGNLWLPHEYVVNENIYDPSGITVMGRWDYGPWMNPAGIVKNDVLPSPTITPESFMDTVIVNGCAYPTVTLPPTAFRFRILNACNDRMLNLQLYLADPLTVRLTNGGSGYTAPVVTFSAAPTGGTTATGTATMVGGVITGITVTNPGSGYTAAPTIAITDGGAGTGATAVASVNTEVKMVPASPNPAYPTWPKDGRDGGVPDPTTQGPPMIQIGNEGGLLAKVNVVAPQPVDFDYNRKDVTFGSVTSKSLLVPPAVRADVIVDLSAYAGKTIILYNDAPAPMPLYDVRYDYFTDDPDQSFMGGAPTTPPGYGPNTRTVMQIQVAGTPTAAFNLAALQTALPKAYTVAQDAPLVPESAFNTAYGTTYPDIFANVATESLNVTGVVQPVAQIMTTLPGLGYTTAPTLTFAGGGGTGVSASAGLNPMGGVTLVTGGSGYTSAPLVTLGPPLLPLTVLPLAPGGLVQGIQAQAVATVSGGVVTAITITEPGAGYTDIVNAPVVTIAAPTTPGGVAATATGLLPTIGTVGSIVITNPGTGYLSAPQVSLKGGGGMGAAAVAMLNGAMAPTGKGITEGFDPDYGRMFVQLGSTPNPLTPAVGAGPVVGIAQYIDPPTEILTPEQTVLWKITHLGVDSHALHFHLFDVQVINRVDWANIVKAPYPDEVGWKDTIRTNPFEDIIIALRPKAAVMKLPFGLPDSNRLLDPTTVAGSVANFFPVAGPPGVPAVAQVTNVMTNFGWEYVFHCHLLGHEENDMMRPVVFQVPSTVPAAPSPLTATGAGTQVNLAWTDPTPFNYATGLPVSTLGNPANEIGFQIQRATGATGGTFTQIGTALANATTYADKTVVAGNTYRYRVVIYNAAGSATSNTVSITLTPLPAAPTNLVATATSATQVTLTWRDNATNETGFSVERADNGGAFVAIAAPPRRNGTGNVTYVDSTVVANTPYSYRVAAVNSGGQSGYSNVAAVTTPSLVMVAPTNLTATTIARNHVILSWNDNSNNEQGFYVQRSSDNGVTWPLVGQTAANVSTFRDNGVARTTKYLYRVQAFNSSGGSAFTNTLTVTTP